MTRFRRLLACLSFAALAVGAALPAAAYPGQYTVDEVVNAGNQFFGGVSEGLAGVVQRAVSKYGLPNGYILGKAGSAAIIGGLTYGEGTLNTKNAGKHPVFWEGPSVGFDVGATGSRVMMLVYNLPDVQAMYDRFPGVAGSAYAVAGFGMTVLGRRGVYVVPIISGVGARFGVNFGYLKFTDHKTWNPF